MTRHIRVHELEGTDYEYYSLVPDRLFGTATGEAGGPLAAVLESVVDVTQLTRAKLTARERSQLDWRLTDTNNSAIKLPASYRMLCQPGADGTPRYQVGVLPRPDAGDGTDPASTAVREALATDYCVRAVEEPTGVFDGWSRDELEDLTLLCLRPGARWATSVPSYPALAPGAAVTNLLRPLLEGPDRWAIQALATPVRRLDLPTAASATGPFAVVELYVVVESSVRSELRGRLVGALDGLALTPFVLPPPKDAWDPPGDRVALDWKRQELREGHLNTTTRAGLDLRPRFLAPASFLDGLARPPDRYRSLWFGLGTSTSPLAGLDGATIRALLGGPITLGHEPAPVGSTRTPAKLLRLSLPASARHLALIEATTPQRVGTAGELVASLAERPGQLVHVTTESPTLAAVAEAYLAAAGDPSDIVRVSSEQVEQVRADPETLTRYLTDRLTAESGLYLFDASDVEDAEAVLVWLLASVVEAADAVGGPPVTVLGTAPSVLSERAGQIDRLQRTVKGAAAADVTLAVQASFDALIPDGGLQTRLGGTGKLAVLTIPEERLLGAFDALVVENRAGFADRILRAIRPDGASGYRPATITDRFPVTAWAALFSSVGSSAACLPIGRSHRPARPASLDPVARDELEAILGSAAPGLPSASGDGQRPMDHATATIDRDEIVVRHVPREPPADAPVARTADGEGYRCTDCWTAGDDGTTYPLATGGLRAAITCCHSLAAIDRAAFRHAPRVLASRSAGDADEPGREKRRYLGGLFLAETNQLDPFLEYDPLLDSFTDLRADLGVDADVTAELVEAGYIERYFAGHGLHSLTEKGLAALGIEGPPEEYTPIPEQVLGRATRLWLADRYADQSDHRIETAVEVAVPGTRSDHPTTTTVDFGVRDADGELVHAVMLYAPTATGSSAAEGRARETVVAYLGLCGTDAETTWVCWANAGAIELCGTLAEASDDGVIEFDLDAPTSNARIQQLRPRLDEPGMDDVRSVKHVREAGADARETYRSTGRFPGTGGDGS